MALFEIGDTVIHKRKTISAIGKTLVKLSLTTETKTESLLNGLVSLCLKVLKPPDDFFTLKLGFALSLDLFNLYTLLQK